MGVIRRMFGPSREEIWRQLSSEIGAQYVDGGFGRGDKVRATHGDWTVTLDTYVVSTGKTVIVFTRMRAPYVNPDGFRFTIYRRGMFSGIAKFFGMQDIEIGDAAFDADFIIKGTDELIASQKDRHFTVKDDEGWCGPHFPEGADELLFAVGGVIKDIERLKRLYDLFAETLDELCRMGSAYEDAPDVTV
jgi:hypothetical protein